MGFPLLFAVGAAAIAGAAIYSASKKDDDYDDYDYEAERREKERRAAEQARKEREARERQAKIASLENSLGDQRKQAHIQLSNMCTALADSDLISVSWDFASDNQQLHNMLTQNTTKQLSCDVEDKLLKKRLRENMGLLQDCNTNISIELTETGKQACQTYNQCQDSMQQLNDQNSQLEKALRRLKRSNVKKSA